MRLWLVNVDKADRDYDQWVSGAVWAESADQAEAIARAEIRTKAFEHGTWPKGDEYWLKPEWSVHVNPAPTQGVALVYWHAG